MINYQRVTVNEIVMNPIIKKSLYSSGNEESKFSSLLVYYS